MTSKTLSQLLLDRLEHFSDLILARQFELQADLAERYPPDTRGTALRHAQQSLLFLGHALGLESPLLFSDYIAWLKVVLESRDIPVRDLRIYLHCLQQVLTFSSGPEETEILSEYLDLARAELEKTMPYSYRTRLAGEHGALARAYLDALLVGSPEQAERLALEAVERNELGVRQLYQHVFQPVMYEIGRLWQFNQLPQENEKLASGVTLGLMESMGARLASGQKNGRTAVVACSPKEQHSLGARMVADILAEAGWAVTLLPVGMGGEMILQAVRDCRAGLLALSATLAVHVQDLEQIIVSARKDPATCSLRVLVGGAPFNLVPNLWRRIGADSTAFDGEQLMARVAAR